MPDKSDHSREPLFESDSRPSRSRVRWLILTLSFFGITCAYITRLNLSLAIVAMVVPPAAPPAPANGPTAPPADEPPPRPDADAGGPPRFRWDSTSQALILGSFFYTYGLLQVPGARWCERFGAKWPCFVITLGSGLISLLLPLVAPLGVWTVVLLRAALGLCQSAVYPAYYALLSRWFPEQEQSTALGMLANGGFAGAILAMLLTGFFCEHNVMGGWPSVFYTCALVCLVWCGFWLAYAEDRPAEHPRISDAELRHIERHKPGRQTDAGQIELHSRPTPWRAILTSQQVWAVIVAKFGVDWLFWLIMLNLPLYLNNVLHVRIHQNGLINSAVNAVLIVSNGAGGLLADHVVARRLAEKTRIRKCFQTVAVIGSSLCLLLVPLAQRQGQTGAVIALFLLLMFCFGLNIGGDIPIVIDMTEEYPATIFAIANAICSSCGFLVPLFTGLVLGEHVQEQSRWTLVFVFAVLVNVGCLLFFLKHGSSEPLFRAKVIRLDAARLIGEDGDSSDGERALHEEDDDDSSLVRERRAIVAGARPF